MSQQISNTNCEKYTCIICMDWCKKPISCVRCHKLICKQHVWALRNKCAHCRLEPFRYTSEPLIQTLIELQVYKIREKMKKQNTFKCLVKGCTFQGKYPTMEFHRKSRHFQQKIDEILFPQERQNKLRRDALKKLFIDKIEGDNKKYKQKALVIYVKTKGIFEIQQITKMVAHTDKCQHPQCKQVLFNDKSVYIGNEQQSDSNCPQALTLRQTIQIPQ